MTPEILTALMFVGVFIGVFLGLELAFTLAGLGIIFGLIGWGFNVFGLLGSRVFGQLTNYTYVAVPLFIFMGCMLETSGVSDIVYGVLNQWLRNVKGGLALATIILCTIFATCTGIVGAAVTTIGLMALPAMIDRGYDKSLATGSVAAGGTLGILIPPSVMLVLFGPLAGLSIVDLFAAAFVPGFLLATLYIIYIIVIVRVKKDMVPKEAVKSDDRQYSLREGLLAFVPFITLVLLVIGAIFFGITSATEAAGIGAFGSILIAAAYRKCSVKVFAEAAMTTLKTTCMVVFVAIGANIFTAVFFGVNGGKVVTNFVQSIGIGPYGTLFLLLFIVFILGMLIDWLGILLVVVPIFMPILNQFGFDPLWSGMLIIIIMQTSFITPPFAYSLFYVKGIAPEGVEIGHIYRGAIPFIILQMIGVTLCIVFPQIITFLPALLK